LDKLKNVPGESNKNADVRPEVALGANQEDGGVWTVRTHLGNPLGSGVVKGGRRHNRETNYENVGAGVTQRPQRIKVVLKHKQKNNLLAKACK
jgi:hypothetical protein